MDGKDSCPECTVAFEMSSEGVRKYENIFLTRLADVRRVSNEAKVRCELCSCLPNDKTTIAEYYCLHCHQNLCAECKCRHRHIPYTANHAIVRRGRNLSDEVFWNMKQSSPYCSVHWGEMASWLCNQCELYVCVLCEGIHAKHDMETIDSALHKSQQHIADTLPDLKKTTWKTPPAAFYDQKVQTIQSKTERLKERVNNRMNKMIRKMKQEATTLNDEANSWCREQLRILRRRYGQWKLNYPSMRARKRWIMYADALTKKGTATEQLANFKWAD